MQKCTEMLKRFRRIEENTTTRAKYIYRQQECEAETPENGSIRPKEMCICCVWYGAADAVMPGYNAICIAS